MPTSDRVPSLQLGQRICQPPQQRQKAAGLSGATDGGRVAAVCDQDPGAERGPRLAGLKERTRPRSPSLPPGDVLVEKVEPGRVDVYATMANCSRIVQSV
ncbi:hypothetical protein GN956_G17897 [Arapaima gigas]